MTRWWRSKPPNPRKSAFVPRFLQNSTGEVLKEMDISEVIQALGAESLNDWALDGKGNIYLCLSSCIAVLDNNGQKIFTLDAITPDRAREPPSMV